MTLAAAQIHVETSDAETNYTYGIYLTTAACRFWNDSTDSWSTAGCKVHSVYLGSYCLMAES